MVKLARGGMMFNGRGRSKPRPLFPPGELPLFGPPPAYMRRPPGLGPPMQPMPPPARGPPGYDYGHPPPPMPMRPPPHLGPPMPPPQHMPIRGRPGRPLPLLQAPVMPPRPPPFMRSRGMPPRMPPVKKNIKKAKNRRNKKVSLGPPSTSNEKPEETPKENNQKKEDEDILSGPWINDAIKSEIDKMNELKKKSDETKATSDLDLHSEQEKKVQLMASAAKMEYIGTQPDSNEEYYCEVCDRSWKTPEMLEEHISNHVTCQVEGCSFTAASKVVALHVKLQHDSGMFDKIVKSTNKEDIEKWKEERRRNFPTLANIEQKNTVKKEMDERGERIEEKNNSFRNQHRNNHMKDGNENKFSHKRKRNHSKKSRNNRDCGEKQKFLSTASLPNDLIEDTNNNEDNDISDDEWISDNKSTPKETQISNVLMAICSAYGSDDDVAVQENISKQEVLQKVEVKSKNTESDDEPPLEEKIDVRTGLDSNIEVDEHDKKGSSKRIRVHKKNIPAPKPWQQSITIRKRPLTLLEKLLAKEIKQERNYILQCIRFIINKNYFDAK